MTHSQYFGTRFQIIIKLYINHKKITTDYLSVVIFLQITTILSLFKSVVKKTYESPPSFILCFLRISSTFKGKLRVVTLALVFSKYLMSFLLYEITCSILKHRPGKSTNSSEVYKCECLCSLLTLNT